MHRWHQLLAAASTLVLLAGLLFASVAGSLPIVFACPLSEPRKGGELKVAIEADITGTDPHLEQAHSSLVVLEQIYEGLVKYDYRMHIVPCLAEDWQTPDPQTYVFHLRRGVRFHNGREMVAVDVKYSLERIMDPQLNSPYAGWLTAVSDIETPDDFTVTLRLSRPNSSLLGTLAWRFFAIVPREAVEADIGGDQGSLTIGTGPFRLVEWKPHDRIRLERNPDYWQRGLPYLDAITFLPMDSPAACAAALRRSDVDFLNSIAPQDVDALRTTRGLHLTDRVSSAYTYVGMNCRQPPFSEAAVRQAIALALDRQMYVDRAFLGHGESIDGGPIPQFCWAYCDLHSLGDPDLKRARKLLASAGHANGLVATLKTLAEYPDLVAAAQVAQENLAEIGIEVDVKSLDTSVFVDEVIGRHEFDLLALSWGEFSEPDDYLYAQFHSNEAWNYVGYSNPKVDSMLDRARAVPSQAERATLYREIQKVVVADAPYAFLAHPRRYQGRRGDVQGFTPAADGSCVSFMETWLDR